MRKQVIALATATMTAALLPALGASAASAATAPRDVAYAATPFGVVRIDRATETAVATVSPSRYTQAVAITPDGAHLYAATSATGSSRSRAAASWPRVRSASASRQAALR